MQGIARGKKCLQPACGSGNWNRAARYPLQGETEIFELFSQAGFMNAGKMKNDPFPKYRAYEKCFSYPPSSVHGNQFGVGGGQCLHQYFPFIIPAS